MISGMLASKILEMKKNSYFWSLIGLSLLTGFLGGLVGAKISSWQNGGNLFSSEVERSFYLEESETISAITAIEKSVVSISAIKDFEIGLNPGATKIGGGTGFVVSADGLVITNKHVVADGEATFKVTMFDGKEYPAEIVSSDPFEDVAVLRVVADLEFVAVKFGDSSNLQVGQRVLAMGNALARYENTVTSGIISAQGRDVAAYNDLAGAAENLSGLIQTDAAINLGNSGGPLVNLAGEVIGMNVAVAQSANGIGFAIPSNDLAPILRSVEKYGEIVRPVLGVRFLMLSESQAQDLDQQLTAGALIIGNSLSAPGVIAGGAAESAGLLEKDVIISVNGEAVNKDNPLQRLVRAYEPGDLVVLKVWRNGKVQKIEVVLKSSREL